MRYYILNLFLVFALFESNARGDHSSPVGSIERLLYEAERLEEVVMDWRSNLREPVVRSVRLFTDSVRNLQQCTGYERYELSEFNDHLDDIGVSSQCRSALNRVLRNFGPVQQYLYDTKYDLPQVFEAYVDTSRALEAIRIGRRRPGGRQIQCMAVDRGWEEHRMGHVGYGRTLYEAQRNALRACQLEHDQCRIRSCN